MKRLTFILALFLLIQSNTQACSCSLEYSFCDMNSRQPTWSVFMGKILRHDSLYSEFKIFERLRGVELRDTIKIWDNPTTDTICFGAFYKRTVFLGSVGDSILIIMPRIDTIRPINNWGVIGDYYRPIGFCSAPFLPIQNGIIIGNLIGTNFGWPSPLIIDTVLINTFKSGYSPSGRAHDCNLFVGVNEDPVSTSDNLNISPNPFQNTLNITGNKSIRTIEVFNAHGEKVFYNPKMRTRESEQIELNFAKLENGIYFLSITSTDDIRTTEKIIKQ